jgi:hypothetical protein
MNLCRKALGRDQCCLAHVAGEVSQFVLGQVLVFLCSEPLDKH